MDQDRATVTEITLRSVTIWSAQPPQARERDTMLRWLSCLSLFFRLSPLGLFARFVPDSTT